MKSHKVQLNVRVTPELLAYLKQKAPSNVSHYVEEILRKDMLEDVADDVVARLAKALVNNQDVIIKTALAKKRIPHEVFCPCILPSCPKLHYSDL